MGLSRLCAKCQACSRRDKCDHKRMGALAVLPLLNTQDNSLNAINTNLREVVRINVNFDGHIETVYKDDWQKQLSKAFEVGLLQGRAKL